MKKVLFFLVIAFLAALSVRAQDATTYTKIGDKVPAFKCTTLDGKTIDIQELKGKVILINFFATWCPPCNQELPVLQSDVWEKYKNNRKFVLLILGREHTEKELTEWVAKKGFVMPFAPDPKREIYSLFAKESIPRNVIIGKDGKIAFQSIGYTPEEFTKVLKTLEDLLK